MLDMGFVRDVRKIVAKTPESRQSLLFSATMPGEIARLSGELLNDPVRVEVTPQATPIERLDQSVHFRLQCLPTVAQLVENLLDHLGLDIGVVAVGETLIDVLAVILEHPVAGNIVHGRRFRQIGGPTWRDGHTGDEQKNNRETDR